MPRNDRTSGWGTPALLGAVLGAALQVRQPALWDWPAYAGLSALAVSAGFALSVPSSIRERAGVRAACALLAAALLSFSACGLRSVQFAAQALAPALEGRDVSVTGVVAAMPQRNEIGLRFRFEVESASVDARPVRLVRQVYLGWYVNAGPEGQRAAPELRAGERWRMNARLKAPHGNINPHGFDYELWLWEQGVQATGYVRDARNDPPPQRIGGTWRHPVETARQTVRDAVFAHVADRKTAGLLAALVTGDQNAIDVLIKKKSFLESTNASC